MFRSACLYLLVICCSPSFSATFSLAQMQEDKRIQVQVNTNVELLGFVYFLGYEGRQSETDLNYSAKTRARYAYGLDLYQRYKKFENSKNLSLAIGFAEHIWLDYFIALLLQLEDFPNAKLNDSIPLSYYVRFSPQKDSLQARKNADTFITAMNELYQEVDFSTYLHQSKPLYQNAVVQVNAGLPDSRFITQMEAFYQGHFDSYVLIPSLTIPASMGFGINYNTKLKSHAVHVFGTFSPPSFRGSVKPDMGFSNKQHLLELSTHEFGHSFVNPAVNALPLELINKTRRLYEPIREAMSNQAYTKWESCLSEHFVRAGEVIIGRNLGNIEDAERLKDHYIKGRQFIYLPILIAELEKYNVKRDVPYPQAVCKAMLSLDKYGSK
ncbi:hypothetical protein DSL64_15545 [Dyadobacter luteus]|uniref:DUF4932 domain-containing protein n=2 Tax=Dyadobacter luteus TaxID=2259619 RepID=A0A3D8Y9F5_9BACT|nr:hypothetical protein DSL64_15545 [Dyadobacter luteus]